MASSPKARGTFAFIVLTTAIVWSLPRVGETQGGLAQQVANLEARVAALEAALDAEATARAAADTTLQNNINAEAQARQNADNQLQNNIDAEAAARQAADTLLQNQIDALEACSCTPPPPVPQQLLDFANFLTIDRSTIKGLQGPHVIVTGANFHIRNGRDEPNPSMFNGESYTANGLGNLIVGYNGPTHEAESNRTGSHNVVIGDLHTYTGSGGFVAGFRNYLAEDGTSILGGVSNMLFGALSTVLGGEGWVTDQPLTILPPIQ